MNYIYECQKCRHLYENKPYCPICGTSPLLSVREVLQINSVYGKHPSQEQLDQSAAALRQKEASIHLLASVLFEIESVGYPNPTKLSRFIEKVADLTGSPRPYEGAGLDCIEDEDAQKRLRKAQDIAWDRDEMKAKSRAREMAREIVIRLKEKRRQGR
jgi:hypothetical protein